jgi:hypothetical protein
VPPSALAASTTGASWSARASVLTASGRNCGRSAGRISAAPAARTSSTWSAAPTAPLQPGAPSGTRRASCVAAAPSYVGSVETSSSGPSCAARTAGSTSSSMAGTSVRRPAFPRVAASRDFARSSGLTATITARRAPSLTPAPPRARRHASAGLRVGHHRIDGDGLHAQRLDRGRQSNRLRARRLVEHSPAGC